jgi:tetratricopeptide (TPR) repeat protein
LLADALSLTGPVREQFVAAARGRGDAAGALAARQEAQGSFAAAATRGLPRDIAAFTGRQAELAQLMGMLTAAAAGGAVAGICAIDVMAGIGKTTFAVHAAHRLAGTFPDGQFFLPLHAHTPGQRPVGPADALGSLLLTAGVPAAQIPPGLEARAARWRDQVAGKKILLVLDDAAGHEQVRPLLPGTAGSLVLVTSRRRLAALDDTAVISLDPLPHAQAATLLARLAARTGIGAADPVVGELARLGGYLPLAIGMLASQLRHHPAWTATYLATELAGARDRLAVMRAENLSVTAAFDLSYADLTQDLQQLFRRLGLVPGPSFDTFAAAALNDMDLNTARRELDELYDQHLITEPAPGRYQLHDLLRHHARTLAAADDPADAADATGRLLDYYLHTALAASQHTTTWAAAYHRPPAGDPPAFAPDLATLQQAAAWIETERANLHAAAERAAACEQPQHAVQIPAAMSDFLLSHGHWDEAAALFQIAMDVALRAGDRHDQADTHTQLSVLQQMTGDYKAAATHLARALALYRELGDRAGQAGALTELRPLHTLTGDYPAAEASQQQALALADEFGDRLGQAHALHNLGRVQRLTGDYPSAAASLRQALALFRDHNHLPGQAWALYDLGAAQQEAGDYPAAAASLKQALALFRDAEDRGGQAVTLHQLGRVMQSAGDYPAASGSHQQALKLSRDLGARRSEAEILNSLGELASRTSATQQARGYHTQALAIACDIGAALVEACALEGLGQVHFQDGEPGEAVGHLRQALTIYQRIGAPRARRVEEILQKHGLASAIPEPQPSAPSNEDNRPHAPSPPREAV